MQQHKFSNSKLSNSHLYTELFNRYVRAIRVLALSMRPKSPKELIKQEDVICS